MKLSLAIVWLLLFALCGFAQTSGVAPPQQQSPPKLVRVEGTKVSLVPPPGFVPSKQFTGYELAATGASIIVLELSGPIAQVTAGFNDPAQLSRKAMQLLGRETVTLNGAPATLFHLAQTANGTEYLKWMLALGDANATVLVAANFPRQLEQQYSRVLRDSILSMRWDQSRKVVVDEGVPFSVEAQGGLKLAQQRLLNTLLYTVDGIVPAQSVEQPLFVAGMSISQQLILNPKEFSERRVFATESVVSIGVVDAQPVMIDGLSGYEIVTQGKDRATGQPVTLYQVTLFDETIYYVMQGLIGGRRATDYLGTFRAMARSFKRRATPVQEPPVKRPQRVKRH